MADTMSVTHRKIPISSFIDERDGKEKWQFRDRYKDAAGKVHQVRRITATRKEAERAWKAFMILEASGEPMTPPERLTVSEWLDLWLATVQETAKGLTTYAGYKETVDNRLRPHLGHKLMKDVDEEDVRRCYRKLVENGNSTNTILGAHRRLRTAFGVAYNEGKIRRNPVANVKPPKGKPPKERSTWTFDEALKFTQWTLENDGLVWLVFLNTGMRRGETCGLRWSFVDLENNTIRVERQRTQDTYGNIAEGDPKTPRSKRSIPIAPWMAELLREWRARQAEQRLAKGPGWQGEDYVFTSRLRKPFAPSYLSRRPGALCVRAGVPKLTTHELRHTFASRAVQGKMDVKLLADVLGHESTTTTLDMYVHVDTDHARQEMVTFTSRLSGMASG